MMEKIKNVISYINSPEFLDCPLGRTYTMFAILIWLGHVMKMVDYSADRTVLWMIINVIVIPTIIAGIGYGITMLYRHHNKRL
jgi:hypothetical protein